MKRKLYLLPILLLCLSIARLFGQCGQIVWQDEFNGSAVDNTKWNFSTGGGGWGNFELQTYTNSSNNVRIENGRLVIEAINSNGNYTSARLNTRGKFDRRYGKFEIRAKLPTGTGLWPAFWLLPETTVGWPMSGEIDIMENRGDQPNVNHGTLHYGAGGSDALRRFDGTSYTLPSGNFADSYHTFSVEWEYGVIRWYVDGNLYKTETRSPNSLSQGTTGDPWPWDSYNYYLIVNLAVGGPATPFTGRQNPNFGTSGKLEVEYVRVYSSPQPQIVITGKNRVFQNSVATYSVPTSPGQTYLWTVPVGATITAGQNTNQVTVNWGTLTSANIGVRITHGAGASCPGNSFDYTREVTIYKNECNFLYHNFQGYSTMNAGIAPGVLSEQNNPAPNVVNNSPRVGRYVRNGSQQYDALFYNDALLNPGTDYSSGTYVIKMDVYTAAPVGTAIDIQLGNAAAWGAYPAGIHSSYTAATAAVNQWHTVTFSFAAFVDPNRAAFQNNLDRLVFLFQPNAYTNTTFFIDNIRRELVPSAPTLTINGLNAVANNQTGVAYTATGGNAGNQYLWSTPVGSTIASGANTNAISVNYGVLGGIVSVQERVAAGCYGPVATRSISVGGSSCALFSDEFDNNNTGTWIANSAGSGFIHSEAITDWKVNSPGYGEWAYFEYTINDGTNPVLLDFTNPVNNPVMKIRARASSSLMMSVTLVDNAGMAAANQYLTPLNSLILNSTSQEYTIDFNGQFWDQYGTPGGTLDQSRIAKIRIAFNPGFASFPYANPAGGTFNSAFIGDVFIDYIRIGNDCATALANFSASDFVLCGTTSSVTYTDNSSNTNTSTTYAWNFGAGATPATATTRGPHNVTYSTSGPKTVTLTLNGTVTRERQNYVYVSPASPGGCVFQDEYDNNTVSALTAAQGNFTFTENTNQFHISTTAHGEWETFSQGIEAAGALRPVDFACAGTPAVIKVRAKASSPVALRLNLADVNNRSTNNAATVAQTMVLSTTFQEFTLNFGGRFFDQYSNGGPFQLDSTNITRMMFAVNPGFSSFPWNGFNASFNGTIDIDYIQIGTCAGSPEINVIQAANTILTNGTYSFAAQNVNTASAAVTFTIQNTGNAALNLTGTPRIAISGANAADFTITQPAVSSIAAGANTTFTVVFNPSAAGARTAQLSIANDDNTGAENPYIIVLNGTGNCPTITTANAGADQTVCAATATLAGNVPTTGTGTWSVVSGTATIANPTSANSGVTGLGTGAATLRWTISLASCTPSTDDVVITRNAAPTAANAGADQTVCATTATLAGNAPAVGTGTWSVVSGTATITTPTSPTSGLTAIGAGAVTLRWTVSNAPCVASTDDVVITRNAAPTAANAGADQSVCATTATLAANAPVVGTGTWSVVSGTATIANANSPTSGLTTIGVGAVTLRWTISNAPCAASTDDVVITRLAAPTIANAGSDQSVCATTATLAANAPAVGTGTWSVVSGTATIANANSPTSGLTAIGVGSVTLRWTISNGVCTPSTDEVVITRNAAPTVANAGADQSVCANSANLSANAPTVGTGVWSVITGTATITNPSSATTSVTGLGAGSVTLRWTISNAPCAASTDDVVITNTGGLTTANAGADQT
nr:family 16 glycosylhydrolase [Cytophagaceae bacterium]